MLQEYFPILVFLGVAAAIGLLLLALGALTGAALVEVRDATRGSDTCVAGERCPGENRGPGLVEAAGPSVDRALSDFERGLLISAGVPMRGSASMA